MLIIRSILCPVDFSEPSRRALKVAGTFASRYKSRLTVLTVVDSLLAEAARLRLGLDLAKGEIQPELAEFVRATWSGRASPPETVLAVRVGDAAQSIVDTAATEAIDLIVMGTQGLGGLRKWILGSTTEQVLRQTRTPVLTVPTAESDPLRDSERPLGTGPVLAATDFSEPATFALNYAAQIAADVHVPLLLAHVVEPLTVPPRWATYVEDSNEARVRDARERIEKIARTLPDDAGVAGAIVVRGNPEEGIAQIAEERGADLIVIGLSRDETPFGRRPGSIAYSVLCSARVPVLVVPRPQ